MVTEDEKCGTCDGTNAVARDGGFDACPTYQGPTAAEIRGALLTAIGTTDEDASCATIADAILADPMLGKLLRGAS